MNGAWSEFTEELSIAWSGIGHEMGRLFDEPGMIPFLIVVSIIAVIAQLVMTRHNKTKRN